jgi:fermentation-respiration switch protein FrsA (DUF1100 family)
MLAPFGRTTVRREVPAVKGRIAPSQSARSAESRVTLRNPGGHETPHERGTRPGAKPPMFKAVLLVLASGAALYALVCLVVYLAQVKLVFFPGPPPSRTPADAGLAFDAWTIATSDGERLDAWLVRAPGAAPGVSSGVSPRGAARGALLFCHGNAGTIENRLDRAQAFARMGLDVLLFDYRGYGRSSGKPTEDGVYLDADSAYDALVAAGFGPERIVAYGESLGGAVAIDIAARRKVAALIVEDSFTSLADMAAELYRWLPARLLARIRFDSIAKVSRVNAPILVVHSPADGLVPFEHGKRLFEAAREPKTLLVTSGGHGEGGFLRRAEWIDSVNAFLASALPHR